MTSFTEAMNDFVELYQKKAYKNLAELADKINNMQDELYAYTDHLCTPEGYYQLEFTVEDVSDMKSTPQFRCEFNYYVTGFEPYGFKPYVTVEWTNESDNSNETTKFRLTVGNFAHKDGNEWRLMIGQLKRYVKMRLDEVSKSALDYENSVNEVWNLLNDPDEADKSDNDATDYHAVPLKQPNKFLEGDNIQVATSTLHNNYNRLEAQNGNLRAKIEQLQTENARLKDAIKKANKLGLDLVFTTWSGKDEA